MGRAPEILTFGCRLNAYESEVIRELSADAERETVVVNTCAVTREAERQARQAIRRARRERPEAEIIVTGCAAQISPERFDEMGEVDRVIGNREKLDPAQWRSGDSDARVQVGDWADLRETAHHLLDGYEHHTRAFVQVQNGCDHRCTFCIIPYGRGPSRSTPPERVVQQVRHLASAGVGEIVLSGVDVTAYGEDLPSQPPLGALVRRILAEVPELPRLRLSSLDPIEIDDDLWTAIGNEPRLMPHLHLSLQAGDDTILARMKRRHRRDDVRTVVARARRLRPEIAFGADLIAGFPTETDDMFERTLALVEELDVSYLHVFPYSARPETPAARMPQVPKVTRKVRAARLRAVGARAHRRRLQSKLGTELEALIETGNVGHTPDFARVRLREGTPPGSFVRARATAIEDESLIASRVA